MSTERIDIEVVDKGTQQVSSNLQLIAVSADKSATAIEQLQQQLNTINSAGLLALQAQMNELSSVSLTVAATFAGFNQVIAPTVAFVDKLSMAYQQLTKTSTQAASAQINLGSAMRLAGGATGVTVPTGSSTSVRALDTASQSLVTTYANLGAASELLAQAWMALDRAGAAMAATFALVATQGERVAAVLAEAAVASELQARQTVIDMTAMEGLARQIAALGTAVAATNTQLASLTTAVEKVGTRTRATSASFLNFNNIITATIAIQAIKWVVDLIDAYTSLSNRMAVIATANVTAAQSLQSLFNIANDTRASVESLAQVYQQTGIAAKELGATQREMNVFVRAVAEAIAIQGGSASSSRGALIQLSQALGTGKIRAEEFNSMLEGSYTIVQYAARGIDRMGGSVATLRQEVLKGKVSSTEFFNALVSQASAIDEQFKRTAITITQSMDVMRNKLIEFVGTSHIASDVSQTFGLVMVGLAHSIDMLGRSIAALTVGGGLFGLAALYNKIKTAIDATIVANVAHNAAMQASAAIARTEAAALATVEAGLVAQVVARQNSSARLAVTASTAATMLEAAEAAVTKAGRARVDQEAKMTAAVARRNVASMSLVEANAMLATSEAGLASVEAELLATRTALNTQTAASVVTNDMLQATTLWGLLVSKVKEYSALVVNFVKLNPFVGVAGGVTAVLGVLYAFSDQIKVSSDGLVTLHDLIGVTFGAIGSAIGYAYQGLKSFVAGFVELIGMFTPNIFKSATDFVRSLGFKDAEISLYGFTRAVVSVVDTTINLFSDLGRGIVYVFTDAGKRSKDGFVSSFNKTRVGDYLFGDLDAKLKAEQTKIKDEMKYWQDWLKDNAVGGKVTPPKSMNAEELKKTVEIVSKFNEELDKQLSLLNTYGDKRKVLQEIEKLQQKLGKDNLDISKAQRTEIEAYITKIERYKQVSGMVDQLYNASQQKQAADYWANIKAIGVALDHHLITLPEATAAFNKLNYEYSQASAKGIDKLLQNENEEFNKQQALLGKVGNSLIAANAAYAKQKEALAIGHDLTTIEKERVSNLAVATERTKQLNAEVTKLYNETVTSRSATFAMQQEAIAIALNKGVLTSNEAAVAVNKLKFEYEALIQTPVGKFISDLNDQLEKQQALAGKVGVEAAKATALYDAQQKAKAAGTTISEPDKATILETAAAIYAMNQAQLQFNEAFSKAEDPVKRFNEKMDKTNKLLHDGIIDQEGYNRARRAFEKERDSSIEGKEAFNIEHINKKLQDQIEATKLLGDEKERMNKFDQIKESLDSKHITLTDEQTKKIKDQIAVIVEQTHVQQQLDTIYKATEGVMKDYNRVQEAINIMYIKSPQYVQQYAKALVDARMKVLEVDNTIKAGLEHGLLAQLKKVSDVTGIVSNYMTNAFTTFENAFVDFLKTGKFAWADFARSIIEQTMHMITQLLIIKPILEAIKNSISGSTGSAGGWVSSLGSLVGFADGGEFVVGGSKATDSNVVAFRATAGETVTVSTPGQKKAQGTAVNVHIQNFGSSKAFDVQQVDAETVRIIARDEAHQAVNKQTPLIVASSIRDPNSIVSKSLNQHTTSQRKRG